MPREPQWRSARSRRAAERYRTYRRNVMTMIVIGAMLDFVRSLGAGIDRHEDEDRTPVPRTTLRARAVDQGTRS